eukprot:PRCOL_00000371-RA
MHMHATGGVLTFNALGGVLPQTPGQAGTTVQPAQVATPALVSTPSHVVPQEYVAAPAQVVAPVQVATPVEAMPMQASGAGWGYFPWQGYMTLQPRGYSTTHRSHPVSSLSAAHLPGSADMAVSLLQRPVGGAVHTSPVVHAPAAVGTGVQTEEEALQAELARCHTLYRGGSFTDCAWALMHLAGKWPGHPRVLLLLGAAYYQLRDFSACIAINQQLIQLEPTMAEAYLNMANALRDVGDLDLSLQYYLKTIALDPNYAAAYAHLAAAYVAKGSYSLALDCHRSALLLDPTLVDVHVSMGQLLRVQGLNEAAKECFSEALRLVPDHGLAWSSLTALNLEMSVEGGLEIAGPAVLGQAPIEPAFPGTQGGPGGASIATAAQPGGADSGQMAANAYWQLGNAYRSSHMLNEAVACYRQALAASPLDAPVLAALGGVLHLQGATADALACFSQATALDPANYVVGSEYASVLKDAGRVPESIAEYARVVATAPHIPELQANLASAYKDTGQNDMAIKYYMSALQLRPDFPSALANVVHSLQCVCDWRQRDLWFERLEVTTRHQISIGQTPAVQPFHAIAYPVSGELALKISERYAVGVQNAAATAAVQYKLSLPLPLQPPRKLQAGERLRVAYVSSDFGNHPLSHLMGSVFGLHDRSRFEVFCYALSPPDGTEWRARIESEAEHFLDVNAWTVTEIAARLSADRIHVAINLNGYTKGARNEIFALKPAPVQVSYMGFPSTTGADYIDYLVTDAVACPPEYAHYYSEKLVYVPNCYFVNDYAHRHRDLLEPSCGHGWTRAMAGLPEGAVVYYCANQLYKIDPETFDTWCNILRRVPNSVLWLLRFPPAGEMRLLAQAAALGVDTERIIFTDVAGKDDHIRRSKLADVFLDTPVYNAHTTGCDVLWAGVPIITYPAKRMASRVAASLCSAAGFGEEMVVSSMKEYEERAVELGNSPQLLRELQQRLSKARLTCALFDTKRWVRNLDKALMHMWDIYADGGEPMPFAVVEEDEAAAAR